MTIKIATIVGTRPQFVKIAPVSTNIRKNRDVTEILINTGQHYDDQMSRVFFDELEIPQPSYNLNVGSNHHGKQTGDMLTVIEQVLLKEKPEMVLVYGDTNSTLAGALAASKLHIPVAHVESGLRSYNRKMPEEINRLLTDQLSDILFVPTEQAKNNLLAESFAMNKIHFTGDVMYDAALFYSKKAEDKSNMLQKLKLTPKNYILCTIHRAENTDNTVRLQNIVQALIKLAKTIQVVVPLHPRTKKTLHAAGLLELLSQSVTVIEPVGFLDMIMLEKYAKVICTDSGGVQKEAYFYKVPCITLRDETEWVELVKHGWNTLISPNSLASMIKGMHESLQSNGGEHKELYGDGTASCQIIDKIKASLRKNSSATHYLKDSQDSSFKQIEALVLEEEVIT